MWVLGSDASPRFWPTTYSTTVMMDTTTTGLQNSNSQPGVTMALCAAPVAFIQAVILGMIIWSSIPAFVYSTRRCSSEAIFAYTFAVFKFFFLFWVDPYCLVTVRNSKWMTRTRTVRPQPVLRRNFSSSNPQAL